MKNYILALDQGTTSTRALLLDEECTVHSLAQRELECFYPHPGWVEQDANSLFVSTIDVINELLIKGNVSWEQIAAIGLSNQRETTIAWDKRTGQTLAPAIVWQSMQTKEICDSYAPYSPLLSEKTGLRLNPYFSASKIRFLLDHIPNAKELIDKGALAVGTVDSWLIYKLTKGKVFATDHTNASRTMLYNLKEGTWDQELCDLFKIPMSILPTIKNNNDFYGEAAFFDVRTPIHGVIGDQQSALFGQGCFNPGESKNTYGTGCFMLMNTGEKIARSKGGLLSTVASSLDGKRQFALEGSVFVGGAVVQWLRDQMRWFKESKDSEEYALRREDGSGIYFVPAFVGLGTPYWDDEARGAIFGLTRGSDRHQIVRAALEAIAYQSKDVIDLMIEETGLKIPSLKVDGGASSNSLLMQFQSDILGVDVVLPHNRETTAMGAGFLAGLGVGFYPSLSYLADSLKVERIFHPSMEENERNKRYKGWKKAVEATRVFKVD